MADKTDSVMRSPVTISGVESISDVGSAISVGDEAVIPDTPGNPRDTLFDLGMAIFVLWHASHVVNGVTLETHKYLIKRFSGLKDRIRNNAITLEAAEFRAEDFQNTFKVLYASVIEGPFHFDPITLTSALRVATTYDYPALRNFSIRHLEKAKLSAVERIRLAREFGLPSWEEPAYVELCNRDEAMAKEEANVLGLDAFVHVARIREKEQRRRGRDIDAAMESDDECQTGEEPAAKPSAGKGKKKKAKKYTPAAPDLAPKEGDKAEEAPTKPDKQGQVGTIPEPSFINVQTKGAHWRHYADNTFVLDAPGCECTPGDYRGPCTLPPCVASAIKHLQTQQLAHNNDISRLETTMEHVQTTLTSLATPKPHAEPDSDESMQTGCVEEEVRKWLVGVEGCAAIA